MSLLNQYACLIPICPCLAAACLGLGLLLFQGATRSLRWGSAILSIGMLGVAFVLSWVLFLEQITGTPAQQYLWHWLSSQALSLEIGYLVDPLSSIMLVLVTTVGTAVMVYSHGYMAHDRGYVRFFAYLSLFTASMLGLVLSPNLIQVYMFWELVGMCSYLLVGFWFTRPSAAHACQKAFITNRIGDLGLLLGILGFYWITGSFEFGPIAERCHQLVLSGSVSVPLITCLALLLFLGPVAKSAQFPLHVWLPDAMEGPTPISALIHAATMVAAGVFLVARLLPLFEQIPLVMDIIASTGAITALLGATLALAQRDLKRGLAYSTMSQLGYMILAMGVGSYSAGLFHLITHAYSKALLFLASGSVIHGMEAVVGYHPSKSQDMAFMGGLRAHMPITGYTFLIGTLSLCGIPPLACFWSKDEILAQSWTKFPVLGWVAWITAGLTAFYMARMYLLTFEGCFRGVSNSNELNVHLSIKSPKESSLSMLLPLMLLAVPASLVGLIGAPFPLGIEGSDALSHWLHLKMVSADQIGMARWNEFALSSSPSVMIALIGAITAWQCYGPFAPSRDLKTHLDPFLEGVFGLWLHWIYQWSLCRGYIDRLYESTLVRGTRALARLAGAFDQRSIDGVVNATAWVTLLGGESTRYAGVGRLTSYLFVLLTSLVLLFSTRFMFGAHELF